MSDEDSEGSATLVAADNQISVSAEYLSQLQATEVELDACFDKIESLELKVNHLEVDKLYLINQLERSNNAVSDLKLSVNRLESESGKLRHQIISIGKDNIELKKDNIEQKTLISNQGSSIDFLMRESKKNKEKALRALVPKALREALPHVHLKKLTPKDEAMLREVRETRNALAHLIREDDIDEVVSYKLVCLKNKLNERECQVEAKKIVGDDVLRQILTNLSLVSISEEFVPQESLVQAVSDWLEV